jgi:hypothetical protein
MKPEMCMSKDNIRSPKTNIGSPNPQKRQVFPRVGSRKCRYRARICAGLVQEERLPQSEGKAMMGIDCDIDLQEHRMVRPASRLGCRLQIRAFPLSAEAIALPAAGAKFPVVGQAI